MVHIFLQVTSDIALPDTHSKKPCGTSQDSRLEPQTLPEKPEESRTELWGKSGIAVVPSARGWRKSGLNSPRQKGEEGHQACLTSRNTQSEVWGPEGLIAIFCLCSNK